MDQVFLTVLDCLAWTNSRQDDDVQHGEEDEVFVETSPHRRDIQRNECSCRRVDGGRGENSEGRSETRYFESSV